MLSGLQFTLFIDNLSFPISMQYCEIIAPVIVAYDMILTVPVPLVHTVPMIGWSRCTFRCIIHLPLYIRIEMCPE